jgi:ubiquinone biosynthesis protein Coq4
MYSLLILPRSKILVLLTHNMALPLLRFMRKSKPFPYTISELAAFPHGSMGKDLADMLEEKKLHLLSHYAKHDMKHILLGYDTTDEGEACLQAFMLGNGRISFPVVSTLFFGLFTMPEHWGKFYRAFQAGRKCPAITHWPWFELLHEPTSLLRERIFIDLKK